MITKIQEEYTLPVEISSYDAGADNRLRLSALLRYQQEAAEQHFLPENLGWSGLYEQGMAFVTSRWHGQLLRLPEMGERVTVRTWHRQQKGARFFRCYEWRDEAGEVIIRGVMLFALVSVEDHRLLRGEAFDRFGIRGREEHTIPCSDPAKWAAPVLTAAGDYTVRWSDTDRNGHMNNTRYADLVCDYLPGGMAGRRLTDVELHFAAETREGEMVHIAAAAQDGTVFLRGDTDRGCRFEARVMFSAEQVPEGAGDDNHGV